MLGTEFYRRRQTAGFILRGQVAAAIGVGYSTVKSWEYGTRPVPNYAINWLYREEHEKTARTYKLAGIKRSAARRASAPT